MFDLHSSVMLEFGVGADGINYELSATASVTVVRQASERTSLYLRMSDVLLKNRSAGGGAALNKVAEDIQRGDCIFVLSNGIMVEFGPRKGISKPASATYRQIASALQVGFRLAGKDGEVEEYDGTGRYVARYSFDESSKTYSKSKLRYSGILGLPPQPGEGQPPLRPEIVKSEGRIQLDPDGAVGSILLKEEVVVKGAQVPVHSITDISLRRVATLQETQTEPELVALAAGFTILPAFEPDGEKPSIEALDGARTQGATFRDILSKIKADSERHAPPVRGSKRTGRAVAERPQSTVEANEEEARKHFTSLVASLRAQTGAVPDAVQMINAGSSLTPTLIDALSSASSSASEEALIGLLASSDPEVKRRALYGLSRQPRPSDRCVNTMLTLLEGKPFDETGLYALSAYSRRFREAGKADRADRLGEYLVKRLSEATGPTKKTVVLRAIEGTAYVGAVREVVSYVKDPDETVRGAAIAALGPMKDPSVDVFLASQLAGNPSAEARLAVIAAARARPPSAKLASAIASIFSNSDTTVRYRTVELFVGWLPQQADLRRFLEKVSTSDSEAKVRDLAKRAL